MLEKEIEKLKYKIKFSTIYAGIGNGCCIVNKGDLEELLEYTEQLESKVKELGKGQHSLMQSRRKWKNRYYKEKRKNVK